MRLGPYVEKLDQALWLVRVLTIIILAMTIGTLLLARKSTIVHVVPAQIAQPYDVGPTTASREYVQQMSAFLVTSALTVSPESADFAARALLRFLTPEARGRLETAFLGDAAFIKRNNLTQAFYPRTVDFFSPQRLRVTGSLIQWVGGKTVTERDAAYNLTIEVKNYGLVITDFAYVAEDARRAKSSERAAGTTPDHGAE
jgi:type IV conjugative transfer system protein TraE